MDETEATNSKLELLDEARNEVIGQFQSTDIVSEYNMKNNLKADDSSIAKNQEFHMKRQGFLRKCLEKDIFLEGIITSVFMDDSSLIDVFESGVTKAANSSELGDIQTVLRAVSHWCMKLHTKSGKKSRQKEACCNKNGFKEATFKEIDKQLRNRYTDVVELMSDLKKPTILNFNKDVLHVHETMMEIMAKLWYNRLCIYQGHKDLGYMQISSKVPGLIGRRSCYRLTNAPPRFVLVLDALNNDHIPEEVNLLVCVGDDLAASVLSKYYNTTPKDMVDQFFCIPVATEYMSFELGSNASSEKFCKRLKLICGHVIKVLYDRDLKQLSVLCPSVNRDRVKSVLEKELKNLQMELETKELEIPFPNVHSSLRIQIGEGLQFFGVTGFQRIGGKQFREVHIRNSARNSDFTEVAEISSTREETKVHKMNIMELCNLLTTENPVEYECYALSLINEQENILVDNRVAFNCSVEVILHCLIKDKVQIQKNGSDLMHLKDAITFVVSGLIRVFAEAGLRTDGKENSTAIWAQANSVYPNQFDVKLVFPNVFAAVAGTQCVESFSNPNFSVSFRHLTKLQTDLKTIRIRMAQDFYHVIEKPLQELLHRMKHEHDVESWITQDSLSSVNRANINLQVLVSVTATENCPIRILNQNLNEFFQPARVTFDTLQLHYLRSDDGTKFLKFLMHITKTSIYLPELNKHAYIYGDSSNKHRSTRILKRQLAVKKRQLAGKSNSCGFSWYLFDFDKTCYDFDTLKCLYRKTRSRLDNLKRKSDISQYFFFEDRPELWLETTADVFSRYSMEIKSTLLQGMDVSLDKKNFTSDLICSVCLCENLEASSADCYLLSVCGHAYCRDCLLQMIIQSSKDRNLPIKCVFGKCGKALSVCELWHICGIVRFHDITDILRNVLKSSAAENPASFGICPRYDCDALCVVYEQDKMKTCLWCQGRFCLQCGDAFHGTLPCSEGWSISDWSIKDWLSNDSHSRKPCPNCGITIQKERGCYVVFCLWCKKYICFDCGQFHSKTATGIQVHKSTGKCKQHGARIVF